LMFIPVPIKAKNFVLWLVLLTSFRCFYVTLDLNCSFCSRWWCLFGL
jgi:hypothetical protein